MDINSCPFGDSHFSSSPSQHDHINSYFTALKGEISNVLEKDAKYAETVNRLQTELNTCAVACSSYEHRIKNLEAQLKGNRVVAVFDTSDVIFLSSLLLQGKAGGHSAAEKIFNAINQYLEVNEIYRSQLWVYIFLDKRRLLETCFSPNDSVLDDHDIQSQLDSFCAGLNEASDRLYVLDVDSRVASQAKIRALLEQELNQTSTERVFLGACHDPCYSAILLRSHITAGFKNKIVLIQYYPEVASAINELELPFLQIPDLFTNLRSEVASIMTHSPPATTFTVNLPLQQPVLPNSEIFSDSEGAYPASDREETTQDVVTGGLSYSSDLGSSGHSTTSQLNSSLQSSTNTRNDDNTSSQTRPVDPSIPLSKHKPPPCTLFYLARCKHGDTCRYGHDYALTPEHRKQIAENAKKSPCPAVNKGDTCYYGNDCCYGHRCPSGTQCWFFQRSRCKFMGAGMH